MIYTIIEVTCGVMHEDATSFTTPKQVQKAWERRVKKHQPGITKAELIAAQGIWTSGDGNTDIFIIRHKLYHTNDHYKT